MASAIYPLYKEALLGGGANTDLTTENVKCILIDDADYNYSATHDFLDDVLVAARVSTSGNLTGKTVFNGVFNADDVTFSSVTGDEVEAILIYIDTGVESTSRLVAYLDSTDVVNLPVTPTGGDIPVVWNAAGIFAL